MIPNALRVGRAELGPRIEEVFAQARPQLDVFRLDPLSHLDLGHVLIRDLETKQPVLFRPYDHEVELLDAWIDMSSGTLRFRNAHGEKSRQMGWTWTCAWAFLWALMYWPVALLAQNVDLGRIDDGGNEATVDSLFGKIRFMASQRRQPLGGEEVGWPEWQRPADYLSFRQQPEHVISNRLSGAFLVGRGLDDDPGRGGTYDAYLGDEFARLPHDESVQASIVNACPEGRLYISTPFGEDNLFFALREARSPDMRYLRHHWSMHPVYKRGLHVAGTQPDECALCAGNVAGLEWSASDPVAHRYPGKITSPWYDTMLLRLLDEETIAQELDINYGRALSARVYPEFSDEVHVLPSIPYDPALPVELSVDYGWSPSSTAVGIWQDASDCLRKIGEVEVKEHTPEQVVQALRATCINLGVAPLEVEPRFLRNWLAIGDVAGEAREIGTGESVASQYGKQGLRIDSRRYGVRKTIVSMKRLLYGVPKPVRYSAATCPQTIRHMKNNRWPTDRRGHRKVGSPAPLNDDHNHACRADAYYVTFKYPAPATETTVEGSGFVLDPDLPYFRLTREEAAQLQAGVPGDADLYGSMRL